MQPCVVPTAPRFEHRTEAGDVLAMGSSRPRLTWEVAAAPAGWKQSSYEIELAGDRPTNTYTVHSSDQVLVPWPGAELASRERVAVRVRVADGSEWSDWSPVSVVEAGLLDESEWTARFITPDGIGLEGGRAPIVQGELRITGPILKARLYATAHGVYEASINGQRVDDSVLAPGWTSYAHRLRYHAYDVTHLLTEGDNTLEALLGNGWYRGRLGYTNDRALYGHSLAFLAQLEVTSLDGSVQTLATDEHWRASESAVLEDDLYDGQTTDLRLAGAKSLATRVCVLEEDLSHLVAPDGPAIRPTGLLPARRVWQSPTGRTLVDFGQNAVGWVRLRVRGLPAGTTVIVRHAEVLDDGELGTRPLRSARATDTYILSGAAEETLEPSLTLHGFRYAEVQGVPDVRPEDLELVVIGSDLKRTGWFSSSDELLDRLHENVVWSTRGNFVDIPTDCPQRDERLGWTGDIQVFAPTATFLYDTSGLLTSWLADLMAEQRPDGAVPHVIPDVNRNPLSYTPAAAWGDAATIVPWTIYQRTGDAAILERQLPSMRAWVDRVTELAGPDRLWTGGFQYGDWLDPDAPPELPQKAKADPDLVATAHFARSAWIVAQAAAVVGDRDVSRRYGQLSAEVRAAFNRAFVTPAGLVHSDSQTGYAVAIAWNLLEGDDQRRAAGQRLADLVRGSAFRISTGFVGTPLVCDALSDTGHADVAYRLLLQTQCPSWLYPVTMGATTIWERWDSMLPDGSINPGGMTSFNHYALGAVADWLHRRVAGLAPAEPGYRRLRVQPVPTAALTHASAEHSTPYGLARVAWRRADGEFQLEVHVPVGASAEVFLPGDASPLEVGHGDHDWQVPDPVASAGFDWHSGSVRDLMDDRSLWEQVAKVAAQTGITQEGDNQAAGMLASYLDLPAARVAHALAPDERFTGAMELRNGIAELFTTTDPRP